MAGRNSYGYRQTGGDRHQHDQRRAKLRLGLVIIFVHQVMIKLEINNADVDEYGAKDRLLKCAGNGEGYLKVKYATKANVTFTSRLCYFVTILLVNVPGWLSRHHPATQTFGTKSPLRGTFDLFLTLSGTGAR